MNKKYIYYLCLFLFSAAVVFIIVSYNEKEKDRENKVYTLLERKGKLADLPEWKTITGQARKYIEILDKDPNDVKACLAMSVLFIQEARITGNYVYYDEAAMRYVNRVLAKDPANFDALIYKSLIYLSQHHFADGLATAQKAKQINPYNAFVYGILVDGNVEMGYYDSAVANSDKMVSIRPDLRSYSRISYLREIYGDYPGAISAMKMAVEAGATGEEATEWARVQLGLLYEKTGDIKNAEMQYTISLEVRPRYAYALAGMGRVAAAKNDINTAIDFFLKADSSVSDNSFKDEMVDMYRQAGEKEKAAKTIKEVITSLNKDAAKGNSDESIGHYADRELAYAYLKNNEPDRALEHALLEYNRRPDNIDVNETVAWVYYNKNDYTNALKYITTALKTKCRNPTLLCRAGLIYSKAGDKQTARLLLQQGLINNPNIQKDLKEESGKFFN
jgi:tetratricopeptide (TPR) repeat protein